MPEIAIDNRDKSLDQIKFILIFCVIVGHAIEPSRYENTISASLYSIIYVFHMPLFILLSGYFSKGTNFEKMNKQAVYLLKTFCVITFFQCIYTHSISPIFYPENSGWYLLSLICWRYIAYFIDKCRYYHILLSLGALLIISMVSFLIPSSFAKYDTIFSFMRTTQFLPFFMIGYYLRKEDIDKFRNINPQYKICIMALALLISILAVIFSGRPLHVLEYQRNCLFNLLPFLQNGITGVLLAKIGLYLSSLIFCLAFMSIKLPKVELFERYGRKTLFMFTFQALVIHFIVHFYPLSFIASISFSFCLMILSCFIVQYTRLANFVTNPFSYLRIRNRK